MTPNALIFLPACSQSFSSSLFVQFSFLNGLRWFTNTGNLASPYLLFSAFFTICLKSNFLATSSINCYFFCFYVSFLYLCISSIFYSVSSFCFYCCRYLLYELTFTLFLESVPTLMISLNILKSYSLKLSVISEFNISFMFNLPPGTSIS